MCYEGINTTTLKDDEAQLASACRTKRFKIIKRMYKIFLEVTGLRLASSREDPNIENILKPYNLFCFTPDDESSLFVKLVRLIVNVFVAFVTCKYLILSLLQLKHDNLIDSLDPNFRVNASHNDKCAHRGDIYYSENDLKRLKKIEVLRNLLIMMGDLWIPMTGTCPVAYGTVSILIIALFFYGNMFIKTHSIEQDHISFLMNPLPERNKMRKEINGVINTLVENLNTSLNNCFMGIFDNKSKESFRHNKFGRFMRQSSNDIKIKNNITTKEPLSTDLTLGCHKILLLKIQLSDDVQPIIVSHDWFKQLLHSYYSRILPLILIGAILAHSSVALMTFAAMFSKTIHRLKEIDCTKWQPDGVLLKQNDIYLIPLDTSRDLNAYLEHDGSIQSIIRLALSVELKYDLYWPALIEMQLMCATVIPMWFNTYMCLYFQTISGKRKWMNQLREQIERSIDIMYSDDANGIFHHLIVAYINFEVFKRHQKNQNLFNGFLVFQVAIIILGAFVLCQIGALMTHSLIIVLMYLLIYLAIWTDVYSFTEASNTDRIDKLVKSIARLMAHSTRCRIQDSYPIKLWRSQMMDEEDARNLFSPKVLGFHLTYTRLIQFNGYYVALWLLLYSRQNQLNY